MSRENVAVVRALYGALSRGDLDAAASNPAPGEVGCTRRAGSGTDWGGRDTGRATVAASARGIAPTDWRGDAYCGWFAAELRRRGGDGSNLRRAGWRRVCREHRARSWRCVP